MRATIRLAKLEDAGPFAGIYSHFVQNTPVSFESNPPDEQEMANRIAAVLPNYPWLVCEAEGKVAGYAYASQHRARFHYQWSVDFSVYIHESHRRKGIGQALYTSLLATVPLQGYVSAFAGITLPNEASVRLHESMGFTPVGVYKNVGHKLGAWHDVGWWQRALAPLPTDPVPPLKLEEVVELSAWQAGLAKGIQLLRI